MELPRKAQLSNISKKIKLTFVNYPDIVFKNRLEDNMSNWRDYWDWEFRHIAITLGVLICAGIIFIFPKPLCEKSGITITLSFIFGLGLVITGGFLEINFCKKILKKLSPKEFSAKARFELMHEAIASRSTGTIYALLSIINLSLPIIFQEINDLFIPIFGSIFACLAISKICLATTSERRARNKYNF